MSPHASCPRKTRALLVAGLVGIGLASCVTACGAPSSSHPASEPPLGYRSLPSFLPTTSARVDRVVTASASHPQLAVQGVAVRVELPRGHVLVRITGPQIPPFTAPPPPEVTATFVVTLRDPSSTMPIRPADFSVTDQLGRTFRPTLPVHAPKPPASVSPGRSATFRLTAVLPTGEGRIYWSPTGPNAVVGWDFVVEND